VSQADLERFFYLDDTDRKLVARQREDLPASDQF